MSKRPTGIDVLSASRKRISWAFDVFEKIYVSFSGGKDSTVMLHLVMDEAKKRNRKVGVLFVDLEGQYEITISHVESCLDMYKSDIDMFWCCLPISLRNAVSVYEPHWTCWDKDKREYWIRDLPTVSISDMGHFPFFQHGMEFEEFVPEFGEWFSNKELCGCFVGIRADESLNRFRTIASDKKETHSNLKWTTRVTEHTYNIYPMYDWKTSDLWIYHAKHRDKPYNKLYDYMYKAGLTINQMRICQPYGDDQRRGLWLFHLIEPNTWAKLVTRVNGANGGALYMQEWGNINGYRKISKPPGHTWKSFATLLVGSMPPKTREHYKNKIAIFCKWWIDRSYPDGIPDEAPYELEAARKVPSWRRICKTLLRNDYWCKGLSFTQHRSGAYEKYLKMVKRKRKRLGLTDQFVFGGL
jgi:predicted phosphoadenosine phosphosulfate sulfurtransferase